MERRREWHPLLAAVEGPTGTWRMIDPQGREYGQIELRRVMGGTRVRYRASHEGQIIGWAIDLRTAAERIHYAHLASFGPGGAPRADWGGAPWRRGGPHPSTLGG